MREIQTWRTKTRGVGWGGGGGREREREWMESDIQEEKEINQDEVGYIGG